MKATATQTMTKDQYFAWLKFLHGADVVIGNGKTVWTLKGGWYQNYDGQCVARLARVTNETWGKGYYTYTCDAHRLRLAPNQKGN